jgi:hypothetical protein
VITRGRLGCVGGVDASVGVPGDVHVTRTKGDFNVTLAYLDPASGSMILSAVVGGVAGVGVFAKQARAKLSRKKRTDEPQPAEVARADAEPADAEPADAAPAEASTAPADGAESTDEPTTVSSDA